MRRVLVVIGVTALFLAAVVALTSRPPADVGVPVAGPTPGPTTTAPTSTSTRETPPAEASPAGDVPTVSTRSARLADHRVSPPVAPRGLVIPSLGIDAPIVPVGVEPDGLMTVPEDVGEVGWYEHGPVPGDPGSAVLAGHVDSRTQGRGVFFRLRELQPGDPVEVRDEAGATTRWVVTGRQTIDKEVLPVEQLFARGGAPRLVLVTCGGTFDGNRGSYRSNVVLTAEPRP